MSFESIWFSSEISRGPKFYDVASRTGAAVKRLPGSRSERNAIGDGSDGSAFFLDSSESTSDTRSRETRSPPRLSDDFSVFDCRSDRLFLRGSRVRPVGRKQYGGSAPLYFRRLRQPHGMEFTRVIRFVLSFGFRDGVLRC